MMFGHDHKDKHEEDENIDAAAAELAANTTSSPSNDSSNSSGPPDGVSSLSTPITNNADDSSGSSSDDSQTSDTSSAPPSPSDTNSSEPNGDLLELKKQALQQLSPLVNELDQTPEEKFHTMMMMIQASDDQSLIQKAYDTAGQISDSKVKAQALLDIINEINYFTQHPAS